MSSPAGVPILECRGVTQRLVSGNTTLTVLDQIELRIEVGEFVAIVGPSGSGKSTLLGLLAGLDRCTEGSVLVDGVALERLGEDALSRLRLSTMGFVFQDFQLLSNLTARENVLLPLELARIRDAQPRCRELLARVGLAERGDHYPGELSGGEQQRVALARAFATRPRLLLADEPTGNLDQSSAGAVLALLGELRAQFGTTLVVVTHDERVAALAQRILRVTAGQLHEEPRT